MSREQLIIFAHLSAEDDGTGLERRLRVLNVRPNKQQLPGDDVRATFNSGCIAAGVWL